MKFWVSKQGELKHSGKWPTRTDHALNASIQKWTAIAEYKEKFDRVVEVEHVFSESCALCHKFLEKDDRPGHECDGCPVFEATGRTQCHGSPFVDYLRISTAGNAWREVEFLESLK